MKTMSITLATLMLGGIAGQAQANDEKYRERHCQSCVETWRWERQTVTEQVLVGYENQIVGYEDVTTGYQDVLVGYRDVRVQKTVTEYETRRVMKRVVVGYECGGRPIYECRWITEQVPVCRTIWTCEKQPIYEKRPICEKRPIYERRPVYENRSTCKWVRVPVFICND